VERPDLVELDRAVAVVDDALASDRDGLDPGRLRVSSPGRPASSEGGLRADRGHPQSQIRTAYWRLPALGIYGPKIVAATAD
jgi:hypothetical protein